MQQEYEMALLAVFKEGLSTNQRFTRDSAVVLYFVFE